MWDQKFITFGVLKIDKYKVHIYSSRDNYTTLTLPKQVVNAIWAGNFINITLIDGKIRRYSSRDNYNTI